MQKQNSDPQPKASGPGRQTPVSQIPAPGDSSGSQAATPVTTGQGSIISDGLPHGPAPDSGPAREGPICPLNSHLGAPFSPRGAYPRLCLTESLPNASDKANPWLSQLRANSLCLPPSVGLYFQDVKSNRDKALKTQNFAKPRQLRITTSLA